MSFKIPNKLKTFTIQKDGYLFKFKKTISLIFLLFLSGIIFLSIGFVKGEAIASSLSRARQLDAWVVSEGMILGCTLIPIIIGLSLIILTIIFSSILFIHYINNIDKR
ncbi:hypothetical protein [Xylanivirga thermophila]|uniref:hypothetical protein n=1 Tax=Xylanivirga thermophila TaxID=2496273 RepID=UPI001FB51FA7|nr:hypothetical protein [Xylanivirga thermophila]